MLNAAADARDATLAAMLSSQAGAYDQETYGPATIRLPALLEANYTPAADNPDRDDIQDAMDRYGVQETLLLERGGITFGIFGLVGQESHDYAPTSGFTLEPAAEAAERCVESLQAQGAEVIICLSHSGTSETPSQSE